MDKFAPNCIFHNANWHKAVDKRGELQRCMEVVYLDVAYNGGTNAMAAPRKLPPIDRLYEMAQSGMTHQEIAKAIKEETGEEVSRGAVSAALSRAGKSESKNRYRDVLPWRVKTRHLKEYPARMLRLLGRRLGDTPLSESETARLDSWMEMLWRENAIVAYDPDNFAQGFHYIERTSADNKHVPIRTQRIYTT